MAITNSSAEAAIPSENTAAPSVATPAPEPHAPRQPVSQTLPVETADSNSSQAPDTITADPLPSYQAHPAALRPPIQPFNTDIEAQSRAPSSTISRLYYQLSNIRKRHKHAISIGLGLIVCATITLELSSNISQFVKS